MARCRVSRGTLIVLEGLDKSGKSTHAAKLVESLRDAGIDSELVKFPDRENTTGKLINDYLEKKVDLEDHAVTLLFSANRWENVEMMKKKLFQGITLVLDRYVYSGVAYSGAKEGMSLDWCAQPDVGLPKPDIVFYLCTDLGSGAKRICYDGERYEYLSFQKQVDEVYKRMQSPQLEYVNLNDREIKDVHKEILETAMGNIERFKSKPLGELVWSKDRQTF